MTIFAVWYVLIYPMFDLQKYQEQMKADGDSLDAVIQLLHHTSELVSLLILMISSTSVLQMMRDYKSSTNSTTGCAAGQVKHKERASTLFQTSYGLIYNQCALDFNCWYIIRCQDFLTQLLSQQ